MTTTDRAAFEQWAKEWGEEDFRFVTGCPLENDYYMNSDTNIMWQTWQAACNHFRGTRKMIDIVSLIAAEQQEWHGVNHTVVQRFAADLIKRIKAEDDAPKSTLAISTTPATVKESLTTEPAPSGQWISTSKQLPSMEDADCMGNVWILYRDKVSTTPKLCLIENVLPRDYMTHWMRTGLVAPEVPEELDAQQ